MSRFYVFDDATAQALRNAGNDAETIVNADVPTVVADAVQQQQTIVLVVPAGQNRTTVARITPPSARVRDDKA